MPVVLDGKLVRDTILASLKPRVDHLIAERRPPGLAVVLVGSNPASEIYVRSKVKACAELGIASEKHMPLDTVPTEDLLFLVESLNRRPDIDGILIQLPLPEQVDEQHVLLSIDPSKDVDGFHPRSVGDLVANRPGFRACTPAGVMRMLLRLHRPQLAIEIFEEFLGDTNPAYLSCPPLAQLCRIAGDYERLKQLARREGDLVQYSAALIAENTSRR